MKNIAFTDQALAFLNAQPLTVRQMFLAVIKELKANGRIAEPFGKVIAPNCLRSASANLQDNTECSTATSTLTESSFFQAMSRRRKRHHLAKSAKHRKSENPIWEPDMRTMPNIPKIDSSRLRVLQANAEGWLAKTRKEVEARSAADKSFKKRAERFADDFTRRSARSDASMFRRQGKALSEQRRNVTGFASSEHEIRLRNAIQNALFDAREKSGLSQREIGDKMGIPQPNVSRIEQMRNASLKSIAAYLAACGCSAEIKVKPIN